MPTVDDIKLYFFHHHHYIDVRENSDVKSTWVVPPGDLYDPKKGHELYKRHLRTIKLADQLNFDGICINEHHNTVYSMTPATSLMGAVIATHTVNTPKVMVAGVPINLTSPNRLAEEYGMLDVMSGGRMEYAFPLGTGMEYWSNSGAVNPTRARAQFRESVDILLKAWQADGPIRYEGDFYNYRFLNPWPKPFQKPYPKLFVVGSGSLETVELAIDYDLGYSIVFIPIPAQIRAFERMREVAEERGKTVNPDDLIIVVICYVADTDEEAIREARPHIETFFSWFHRVPPKFLLPPGYVSTSEFLRRASDPALAHGTEASWDDMVAIGRIACGSPQTVADTITTWCEEAGVGRVNVVLELGDMPEWKTVKNMNMFANEVMPRIRARGKEATVTETRELVGVD